MFSPKFTDCLHSLAQTLVLLSRAFQIRAIGRRWQILRMLAQPLSPADIALQFPASGQIQLCKCERIR
jgi:hypothetical protein